MTPKLELRVVMRFVLVILAFASFAAILDTAAITPQMALYARQLGASPAQAGFIAGLYGLVAIPASIVAGILVDRLGRKNMLTLGLLLDAIAVLLYSFAASPAQLSYVRVFHAIGGSLVYPAFIAKARDLGEERVGLRLAVVLAPIAMGYAIGSFYGGQVVRQYGYDALFYSISALMFIAFLASLLVREEVGASAWKGVSALLSGIRVGGSSLLLGLALIFLIYVILGLIVGGVPTALVSEKIADRRAAAALVGAATALASAVAVPTMLVSGYLADAQRARLSATLALVSALALFAAPIIGLRGSVVVISIGLFGLGLGASMLISTFLVSRVPKEARGTAVGLQQVLNVAGVPVGSSLGGVLVSYGLSYIMFTMGGLLLLIAALMMLQREK